MRRFATVIAIILCALTSPGAAQGPRLVTFPRPSEPQTLSSVSQLRLFTARDSAAIQPTYWLEGGLIGGILVGLLGSQLCRLGDEAPRSSCYVEVFALGGGAVGFPFGALIGGQIPKRGSAAASPPPN